MSTSTPGQDTSTKEVDEDESTVSATSNNDKDGAEDDQETSSEPEDESPKNEPTKDQPGVSSLLKKPQMFTSLVRRPPKMRIKLSLRKLPTLANRKAVDKLAKTKKTKGMDDDAEEAKATVVDSDDAGEDDAVAAVVGEPSATSGTKPVKRRSTNPSRAIKMPPLASPGLLMATPTSSTNASKGEPKKPEPKKGGFVAPSQVFDQTMEQAGYSVEARTNNPHRGSSVTRTVGDMFDSNVVLTQRFPYLVPPELLRAKPTSGEENGNDRMQIDGDGKTLPQLLIEVLRKKGAIENGENGVDHLSRKRKRPRKFYDMAPVSLTVKYPEEFVQKRVKYVQDVDRRERAIVEYQELELLSDQQENENGNSKAKVPPIHRPPTPPKLHDIKDFPVDKYEDRDPNCFPKGKESYVAHLDPNCFHISEGRYFGLSSNFIADPNFVGPNAPGLAGITSTGGSGLATSSSGGGISGAMALTLSTTYNGTIAGSEAALRSTSSAASPVKAATPSVKPDAIRSSPKANGDSYVIGPKPTASALDLKKIFDEDENSDLAKSMKDCIIRAAVHASRSGRHGQSFRAPNGEIYPDINKAFFAHGGMKPCQRCKSNKQGAYHCRLRRRHKELDYDGSDSASFLAPFFTAPMDSLICRGDS